MGVKIGDLVLVTSAAEVCTEVGLSIKKNSPHIHTFISAFTNGYLHYGMPAEDYPKGSYEVMECLLAPEWRQIYEKKTHEVLLKL